MDKRTFRIILVKPSHYDDDGYVIQWWLSTIPSNSLASVYGLLAACAQEKTLGPDVDIELEAYDECNKIIDVKAMAKRIKAGGGGFVGLVGVQSNQFPRAVDLARAFRALDVPVVIGGFHVSGCISMLPELPPDLKEAQALGVTLFAGEGEGRMADLLRDIDAGQAKPLYNYLHDMPSMEAAVIPVLPKHVIGRIVGHHACFDAGRGCPFQCSFCTIINVQGRKSRYRTADDVEAIVRANYAQGINHYFVTDDNFARNRNWESILDRLIDLRENKGIPIKLILQVDTLCHRIPGFIEKAARAGCNQVFVGLESVNPESLQGAKKRQNKIWEYRVMLQAWRKQKVMTWAGLITGFPTDTPESIARDIEIIKKELPLDILEFFFLTPLPGSEDHKVLYHKGVAMDPDMNKYDLEHVTTGHPKMSPAQWTKAYRDAYSRYYSDEHVETILKRAAATGLRMNKVADVMTAFSSAARIEGVHPLQCGIVRRKVRTSRRHGLPVVNPLIFYPVRAVEFVSVVAQWLTVGWRYHRIKKRIIEDPASKTYVDDATRPVSIDEMENDELVAAFADKIPDTYGAPKKHAVAAT
ncbi:B12-binding domain-containing radical SAM protein [Roseiarcus sp.]|uniref:B12-binding domain-containing radical SAM protein n=1 Tax=Roseiarcus sp. TaxID=1969460 RepID=UPI003D14E3BA